MSDFPACRRMFTSQMRCTVVLASVALTFWVSRRCSISQSMVFFMTWKEHGVDSIALSHARKVSLWVYSPRAIFQSNTGKQTDHKSAKLIGLQDWVMVCALLVRMGRGLGTASHEFSKTECKGGRFSEHPFSNCTSPHTHHQPARR